LAWTDKQTEENTTFFAQRSRHIGEHLLQSVQCTHSHTHHQLSNTSHHTCRYSSSVHLGTNWHATKVTF